MEALSTGLFLQIVFFSILGGFFVSLWLNIIFGKN